MQETEMFWLTQARGAATSSAGGGGVRINDAPLLPPPGPHPASITYVYVIDEGLDKKTHPISCLHPHQLRVHTKLLLMIFYAAKRRPPEQDSWGGPNRELCSPAFKIYIIYCKYLIYMLKSPRVALEKNIYIYFFLPILNPTPSHSPRTFGGRRRGVERGFSREALPFYIHKKWKG